MDFENMSDKELASYITKSLAEGKKLASQKEHGEETLAELRELRTNIEAAQAVVATRSEQADALNAEVDTARSFFEGNSEDDEEDPADGEGAVEEPPAEEEIPVEEPPAEEEPPVEEPPVEEEPPAEEPPANDDSEDDTSEDDEDKKNMSAISVDFSAIQNSEEPMTTKKAAKIVNLSDVASFSKGAEIELSGAASAVNQRFRGMSAVGDGRSQLSAFHVDRSNVRKHTIAADSSVAEVDAVLKAAADERALEGNSLVAAGGWCSPSEIDYGLLQVGTTDGIFDLPTVGMPRGGVRFTKGALIDTVLANSDSQGFHFTEAQLIAGEPEGVEKPVIRIPCATFEEVRMEARGIAIEVDIPANHTYPELTDQYIQTVLLAHEHHTSAWRLARVAAGSQLKDVTSTLNSMVDILGKVEIIAEFQRQKYRLAFSDTLEGVFPHWVLPLFRADFARRNGVDQTMVTDEQINAHFASRGVRVQYVYNWQSLTSVPGADLDTAEVISVPDEVQGIFYPAGTWVAGAEDIIRVDNVYDSTLLKRNKFLGLFTEEGVAVWNRGLQSVKVDFALHVTGRTGAADIATTLFA